MSAVGFALVITGALLIYAGMTGQSLVAELSAVLAGKSPAPQTAGAASGRSGLDASAGSGSGSGGGGGTSW